MTHQIDENDLVFLEKRYGKLSGWVPGVNDLKTGKINPHQTTVHLYGDTFVSLFHVKPIYYETATGHWRPLSEVTLYHGNHSIIMNENWWMVHPRYLSWLDKRCKLIGGQLLIPSSFKSYPTPYTGLVRSLHESLVPFKIGLTTSTFYPDPHTETTTVDGYTARDGQVESWATCHDNSTGTGANDSAASSNVCYVADGLPTDAKWCYRAIYLFDTSSIADSDTVDSGTFSVYVTSIYDESLGDASKEYLTICSANPASNTAITTSDYLYTNFGTTHYATDVNTFTNTSYNAYIDFTLNASGLTAVSKTGVTKYAMRQGYDISNTAPVSSSGYPNNGINGGKWADETGTTSDPKLVLVHTASASGPANLKSYNTNLKANIKSINTNPIANIKSLNTNV